MKEKQKPLDSSDLLIEMRLQGTYSRVSLKLDREKEIE